MIVLAGLKIPRKLRIETETSSLLFSVSYQNNCLNLKVALIFKDSEKSNFKNIVKMVIWIWENFCQRSFDLDVHF